MKWITREKVKVDRAACPRLIKKFIDPEAEFIFVSATQVEAEAKRPGAVPYDIENCELGHLAAGLGLVSDRRAANGGVMAGVKMAKTTTKLICPLAVAFLRPIATY